MKLLPGLLMLVTLAGAGMALAQTADAPRPAPVRTNQQGAGFKPPATREEWLERKAAVRRRILVSCGLFPMPQKTPLNPRVYGRMERDGYTIEKVVLETLPGFYLSGNLYRPSAAGSGRLPGILNPHGHWEEGRIAADVQARCAGQARMGAVAFLYDMVGYADSRAFGHSFTDPALFATGWNLPGLQLWNSIRALDWLMSLPDVDPERIACTGESGGGTQTFTLCAVDDRVKVAAPVCMVSHHFQGGCQCENPPNLRVGTDNVEFAAAFAPKPMILVGATGDWTSQIMEHGVPEIRSVYRLFGAEGNLEAVVHNAGHNYNQASRESVYTFFKRRLWGEKDAAPVKEGPFKAEDLATLTTWDAAHPRPESAKSPARMEGYLRAETDAQLQRWQPRSAEQWRSTRRELTDALGVLVAVDTWRAPSAGAVPARVEVRKPSARAGGTVDVVVAPRSAGDTAPLVDGLLARGHQVLVVRPAMDGEDAAIRKRQSATYYATYNRMLTADRVHDVLDAAAYARGLGRTVNLIGVGEGGARVLRARPFARVNRVAADGGWEWRPDLPIDDPMALPGALHYGGMKAFAALGAPEPLLLHNTGTALDTGWVEAAYRLQGGPGRLKLERSAAAPQEIVAWVAGK
ncbi:MAG TPA: acetylxylan esterase [Armatimonadota bacterium]|nr:acetylxylan esterase [Armatimonadota bacterium]